MFKGKKILVTGGTGSIGKEIVLQLLKYSPRQIRIFSRDETKQFYLQHELSKYDNLRFLIGDVREKERLGRALEDIDLVFHAAALKHVPLCEYNPFEAVKTNVIGTQNVIEASIGRNVERVIFISTDKATNPVNTMGATKLLAERLIAATHYYKGKSRTLFSSVRFGNVMGSSGSVIELFKKQISKGGPVTLTNPDMTRFMMSLRQAVNLVIETAGKTKGSEIFILKMPVVRVGDLTEVLIEELALKHGYRPEDIKIKQIGARPGEKHYECLMTEEEAQIALETKDMFIVPSRVGIPGQKPPFLDYKGARPLKVKKSYTSKDVEPLSKEEIRRTLHRERLV